MTGEGRVQRPHDPCPRCGKQVPIKRTGRPAIWCSQQCRRAAYEERRAASQGAIAVDVVDRVTYVEHEVNDCLAEVLNSPLASRRVIYRLRQMLRDDELHREGWRDVIMPALSLGEAIMHTGNEYAILAGLAAAQEPRPERRSQCTFNRHELAAEIRDLISSRRDLKGSGENQSVTEFLMVFAELLTQMDRFYVERGIRAPMNQLVVVADALRAARWA